MKLFKKAKKGFTLVELVVVIAVIAILAGVSVGAYFGITESAKDSQAQQEGKAIHTNIVLIANDPVNKAHVTYTKDGLQWATGDHLAWFEVEIEKALGITEVVTDGKDTKFDVVNTGGDPVCYPAIEIATTGSNVNSFTYHLDASHSATFAITTGEQTV